MAAWIEPVLATPETHDRLTLKREGDTCTTITVPVPRGTFKLGDQMNVHHTAARPDLGFAEVVAGIYTVFSVEPWSAS